GAPGDADLGAGMAGGVTRLELRHACRVRREERGAGEAGAVVAQEEAEAADIDLTVERTGRRRVLPADDLDLREGAGEEGRETRIDLEGDACTGLHQVGQYGGEEDDIADPLLAPDQQRLPGDRLAVP